MAGKLMLIEFSVEDDHFIAVAEQPMFFEFEPIPVWLWLKTAAVVAVVVAACVGFWVAVGHWLIWPVVRWVIGLF